MSELERLTLHVYKEIADQAWRLRQAQREYMKKRGDEPAGKKVAEEAARMDELLECLDRLKDKE